MRRAFALVLMLYILVDFATPFLPGAFAFDADDCVDGVSAPRDVTADVTPDLMPLPIAHIPQVVEPVSVRAPRVVVTTARGWMGKLRRAHLPPSDAPSASADH